MTSFLLRGTQQPVYRQASILRILSTICGAAIVLGGVAVIAQVTPLATTVVSTTQSAKEPPNHLAGYLQGEEPNFLWLLPPYPALDSPQDATDVASFRQMQVADDTPRWKLAQADAQMSYARFVEPIGISLDPVKLPIVMHLLGRTERDVLDTAFQAKDYFNRPRPFQRFAVVHVCGAHTPPAPELHPVKGSSYPSGHMAFGWSLALVLAEVAPDRAEAILTRGRQYGESRVVCAVHYPSDVAAGQVIATAVVGRLHSVAEFKRDLACAKQEYLAATQQSPEIEIGCKALEAEMKGANERTQQSHR